MSPSDYLITFYSVIAGLTATVYIQKWGELLQLRKYTLYTTVPLLWSFVFFVMVINEWFINFSWAPDTNAFMFLMSLFVPFSLYFIGMLIFPAKDQLDRNDQFAYLDYFEEFLSNKTIIMLLALFILMIKFFALWFYSNETLNLLHGFEKYLLHKRTYWVFFAFIFALFSEHKLVLGLSALVVIYVWISTWAYVHLS